MKRWKPTHAIHGKSALKTGVVLVMLVDGPAYTREEWRDGDNADYECSEAGEWTFQGHPFAGEVFSIIE